jgi:hypothetical protein
MGQNEAAEVRNRDDVVVRRGLFVGNREEVQRNATLGIPDRFDRGQLRRLMLERVKTVLIAEKYLQRNEHS